MSLSRLRIGFVEKGTNQDLTFHMRVNSLGEGGVAGERGVPQKTFPLFRVIWGGGRIPQHHEIMGGTTFSSREVRVIFCGTRPENPWGD